MKGMKDGKELLRTHISQMATFAVQVSLAALLRSWGIEPAVVTGHSLGEVSAIAVAGIVSIPVAAFILHYRYSNSYFSIVFLF